MRHQITVIAMTILVGGWTLACDDFSSPTAPSDDEADTTTASSQAGSVITDLQANGTGGGASFDGTVNEASDLDDLVETAWGDGGLGLHRGHAPIQNVLEAFFGITHAQMHVYMEEQGLNLAAVAEELTFEPEYLVESLKYSFIPFIKEGVSNGVITDDEVDEWTEKVREQFSNRVYWSG